MGFLRFIINSASHIATVHIMFTELNRKLILTRECAKSYNRGTVYLAVWKKVNLF